MRARTRWPAWTVAALASFAPFVYSPGASAEPASPLDDTSPQAAYASMQKMVEAYEAESKLFQAELRRIGERKYLDRKRQVETNYAKAMAPVKARERDARLAAIEAFERFLKRHPDAPRYTPDAMFRLAELYFERHDDEYQLALKEYRAKAEAFENGKIQVEPSAPEQRFDDVIALYRKLIRKFPDYRLVDGAYYLLGYTLNEQGEYEDGMAQWQALVDRFPESRFYEEVWFRIGDNHFDNEDWEPAIAAFSQVVPRKESPYYDKSLYKLAWTYYLVSNTVNQKYRTAVDLFIELLDDSYKKRQELGDASGSDIEEEALQYVAICMQDEFWVRPGFSPSLDDESEGDDDDDGETLDDTWIVNFAKSYFAEIGARPYEREIYARLGDILFKGSKNLAAVAALERAIELEPLHPDAPKLHEQMIQAYSRERLFDKAAEARDALVARYSEGSEWAKANQSNPKAVKAAEALARTSLYSAAVFYHQQAQKYFEDNRQDLGVQSYKAASEAYEAFLERYPHAKDAYDLRFYLAEAYYYSLRFDKAKDAYEAVRDSKEGTKHQNDAAVSAVFAYEKVVEQAIEAKTLESRELFNGAKVDVEAPAEELAPVRQGYLKAIDRLLELDPANEYAPAFAYRAAALLYTHQQFDDALRRFEAVISGYPSHEAAKYSANLILDYHLAKKDWGKAAAYARRFQEQSIGGAGGDVGEFAKIEGGARFQLATQVLEDGRRALKEGRISEGIRLLEEGSKAYLDLVAEDPKREFADAMVYNAALSLEAAQSPLKAAAIYERLYREYPQSEYAPEAMFRVATKSEQAFQFEKAVSTYLALVRTYKTSKRRADAQLNAALALEGEQKYAKAAAEFARFATLFPERPEAPDVYFRVALVQEKRGDTSAQIKALKAFLKRYQSDAAQVGKRVQAWVKIGEIYQARLAKAKKASARRSLRKSTVAAYENAIAQQSKASTPAARYFAAKAAFNLVEFDFRSYERLGLTGSTGKAQGKQLQAKATKLSAIKTKYENVIQTYKQAEWSLASLYRIGALFDDLQKKIFDAPCPPDVARLDEFACDEYATLLEDRAFTIEDKAVEAYQIAYQKARELKVQNEWTQRTLEALARLRAGEYKVDSQPLGGDVGVQIEAQDFVLPNGGAQVLEAASADAAAAGAGAAVEAKAQQETQDAERDAEKAQASTSETNEQGAAAPEVNAQGASETAPGDEKQPAPEDDK